MDRQKHFQELQIWWNLSQLASLQQLLLAFLLQLFYSLGLVVHLERSSFAASHQLRGLSVQSQRFLRKEHQLELSEMHCHLESHECQSHLESPVA